MKDILKPHGRTAHSTENRVGQAWKAGSVQVIGEDLFGNARIFDLPAGHFQCKYCLHVQKIVRVDERGFAACESCGTVYNDGKPEGQKSTARIKKRDMGNFRASCQRKA